MSSFVRSDVFFVLALVAVNIIISSFLFRTVPFGDTPYYAHMTRVIVEKHSIFENDFFSYFSILLSLVNIPAFLIFRNEFLAIRMTTLVIHSLIAPLFFILFRRLLKPFIRWASLLVVFNPWLLYFSGMFSVSEGLTAVLAMVSFYFFFRTKRYGVKDYFWFSFFSGWALLARTAYLLFVWPFCLFLLYKIYDNHLRDLSFRSWFESKRLVVFAKVSSLILVVLPFGVWSVLKSWLLRGVSAPPTNYFVFFTQIMGTYFSQMLGDWFIVKTFLVMLFIVVPLLFGPVLLFVFLKRGKIRLDALSVTFFAFAFLVIFHTLWYVGMTLDPFIRLRYLVPYFTIGIVAILLKVKDSSKFLGAKRSERVFFGLFRLDKSFVRLVLMGTFLFFFILAIVLNFPWINSNIVSIYPAGYDTITIQSGNIFSAIDWANNNLPEGSDMGIFLSDRYSEINMYYFFPDLLRDDIKVYVPDTNLTFGDYEVLEQSSSIDGFYIFSSGRIQENDRRFPDVELKEEYSSDTRPFYLIYQVTER